MKLTLQNNSANDCCFLVTDDERTILQQSGLVPPGGVVELEVANNDATRVWGSNSCDGFDVHSNHVELPPLRYAGEVTGNFDGDESAVLTLNPL